eukprot:7868072-Alexandrium_andersonii.AAC.1
MREFTDVRPVLPPQSSQPAPLMPRHPPAQVRAALKGQQLRDRTANACSALRALGALQALLQSAS